MDKIKFGIDTRFVVLLLFMAFAMALRIWFSTDADLTSLSNFSPVGAMALFGGAYFSRHRAFFFPLLTLWISDLILSRFVFYGEWRLFYEGAGWTYAAFALMVWVGKYLKGRPKGISFVKAALSAVLIHWIVTDLGVWLSGGMYPMTAAGFLACLAAAIPFEINFLAGTLLYGAVLFGAFEWLRDRHAALQLNIEG